MGEIQYHHAYPGEDFTWKAGIDIFIGEPDARDRGLGSEAIRTMLAYLFEQKGVHLVTIDPEVAKRAGDPRVRAGGVPPRRGAAAPRVRSRRVR